jgi:hypothetical protein
MQLADRHAKVRRNYVVEKLERAKGFEPSTPTLARLCSTPELRPLWRLESGDIQRVRRAISNAIL